MDTETKRIREASARRALLIRIKGAGHPDTIAASREFGAAKLAYAAATARSYGCDELDLVAVVRTGELPAQATVPDEARTEARRGVARQRMAARIAELPPVVFSDQARP
jgi:hypothetical protein